MKNCLKKIFLTILFIYSMSNFLYAQVETITGKVTQGDGEPLIGITIQVKGGGQNTSSGTITDIDGNYSVKAASNSQLTFSYVGFKSQTITVGNRKVINVIMEEDNKLLDEVVVIGYGTMKKSNVTGAISSVKASALENTASAGIESALQGKVPGVFISKTSGKPGATADVKIRGVGSFNGSGPLWIIDGVPQSPGADFNMNDAESVEILRDGSAAAIYGASAANGVVLVTTKRGKDGDAKVNFNAYVGFNNPTNLPDMLNTRQLKELRIEDFNGKGKMTEEEMLTFPLWYSQNGGKNIIAYGLDYDLTNADYNWKDIIFSTGMTQNYDLSFSRGTDKYNYYASFNYFDEKGTYMDTRFRRYSFRLNSEVKLNKWLSFGENMQIVHINNKVNSNNTFLDSYMRTMPFMMPYDESNQPGGFGYFPKTNADGTPIIDPVSGKVTNITEMLAAYNGHNPLADETTTDKRNTDYKINGNIYLKIQPIKDLTITANMFGGFAAGGSRMEKSPFQYEAEESLNSSMSQALTLGIFFGRKLSSKL